VWLVPDIDPYTAEVRLSSRLADGLRILLERLFFQTDPAPSARRTGFLERFARLSGIWSIWIIAVPSITGIWVLIQALLTDNHISIFSLGYVHETMGDSNPGYRLALAGPVSRA